MHLVVVVEQRNGKKIYDWKMLILHNILPLAQLPVRMGRVVEQKLTLFR